MKARLLACIALALAVGSLCSCSRTSTSGGYEPPPRITPAPRSELVSEGAGPAEVARAFLEAQRNGRSDLLLASLPPENVLIAGVFPHWKDFERLQVSEPTTRDPETEIEGLPSDVASRAREVSQLYDQFCNVTAVFTTVNGGGDAPAGRITKITLSVDRRTSDGLWYVTGFNTDDPEL